MGVNGLGIAAGGRVILARHRFGTPEWRLLGGFIARGESLEAALRRELREETGLDIEVGPLLETSTGVRWARVEIVYAYRPLAGHVALSGELVELRSFALDGVPPMRAEDRAILDRQGTAAREWAVSRTDPPTLTL